MSGYWENRSAFPPGELTKHQGKWVAFSEDGSRIVASADDLEALEDRLIAIGEDPQRLVFERIELEQTVLGGGELL